MQHYGAGIALEQKREELARIIVEECATQWRENGTPLFLSALGKRLSHSCPDWRSRLGSEKLQPFVFKALANRVQHLTMGEGGLIRAIKPLEQAANSQTTKSTISGETAQDEKIPRFEKAVWAAFIKPLSTRYRRVLSLGDEVRFEDLPLDAGLAEKGNEFSILADDLDGNWRSGNSKPDPLSISELIAGWSRANGIPLKRLLVGGLAKQSAKVHGAKAVQNDNTILERILSTLSEAELQRVIVPLDVVARLHRSY